MANVSPYVEPNSDEMSPLFRQVAGSIMVAVSAGVLLNVLFRLIFDLENQVSNHLLLADAFSFGAAILLFMCTFSIFFRGVVLSGSLLLGGIAMIVVAHLLS